jgi:cytochrome d ubiquinol oxidase subunit II
MDINIIWFALIVVLFAGYAILDGFDLGIGISYLSFKKENDRQILLKAIGPFWSGNEVWLIAGGGALFAAFPMVYASIFSGLYIPLVLLLVGIIFRAISIEFRNMENSARWKKNWDFAFSISCIIILFVLGVAVGNFLVGFPIDENGNMPAGLLFLFTPFPILLGLQSVFFFAMHGSIYGAMKTEGDLQQKLKKNINIFVVISFILFAIPVIPAVLNAWFGVFGKNDLPVNEILYSFSISGLMIPFLILIEILNKKEKFGLMFLISAFSAFLYISTIAAMIFPNFVISTLNSANNLTIYNAASSPKTLEIMLLIACVGMPIVIAYTIFIYRVFKGKVKLED